ncbi:MAG: AI-2E family transporter [Mariprofundales bacterium]
MPDFTSWLRPWFADKQVMVLLSVLLTCFILLNWLGNILAPVLAAIAIAYVLEGVVKLLEHCRFPRLISIIVVGVGCLLAILFAVLAIIPMLFEQSGKLLQQIPNVFARTRSWLGEMQEHYASWIDPKYIQEALGRVAETAQHWTTSLLSSSLESIPGLITLLVYVVLVPVLVFFLLKDKQQLIPWLQQFFPQQRALLMRVWYELDVQIGNYIRGKFWEMVAVALVTWLAFLYFEHPYALLLGVLNGLSVWIPFVGAAVVTIPFIVLALFQWGWSDTAFYALLVYGIIQTLDANVLIPLLFAEVVNLHPIAIVVGILFFGSLWGVLGVFVAIPLAALVNSVIHVLQERKAQFSV